MVRPGVRCMAGVKLLIRPLHAQDPDLHCQQLLASSIVSPHPSSACSLLSQNAESKTRAEMSGRVPSCSSWHATMHLHCKRELYAGRCVWCIVTLAHWPYLLWQVLIDASCDTEAFSVIMELLLLDLHFESNELHGHYLPERTP